MRWLGSLALVVSIAGCGSNNNSGGDMSMPADMTMMVTGDMAGGGGTACDPGKQTGCMAGERCVIKQVGTGASAMLAPRCAAGGGTTAEGTTCTRGPGGAGDDDCVNGAQCTSISNGTGVFACRHLCDTDADCSGTKKCFEITGDFNGGYCLEPCDAFAAGGATGACPTGQTCGLFGFGSGTMVDMMGNLTVLNALYVCRTIGTVAPNAGDDCSAGGDRDCGANLICNPFAATVADQVCTPVCNNAHGCPGMGTDGGLECLAFDNTAATSGLGFCFAQ